ncbi:MAG: MOSC domain-containing protein [Dehalococcoidia bacterium]|nr:MOSC domain-containing protein [Dehalococcoidia bacterium]
MSQRGSIVQVSISSGGVPKLPVSEGHVTELGIEGDGHDNPELHGGPERALCLFAIERIEAMAAEGHPIAVGSTGENITTRGIDWDLVVPGARLRLGADVLVEVTRYTTPCKTNARWFKAGDFNRMHQGLFPGYSRVYARVLTGGVVRPGDEVVLLPPVLWVIAPRTSCASRVRGGPLSCRQARFRR